MKELTSAEHRLFRRLSSPQKIQDFLDTLAINHEKRGETCMSPRNVLKTKKAHCLEAALLAAAVLWYHNEKPLILHLKTVPSDDAHAITLFKKNGYWGALSKTNHVALRYRDPVYKTVRELALSYFHEYFLNDKGQKTLRAYSHPMNMRSFGTKWITSEKNLWHIADALKDAQHVPLAPQKQIRLLRNVGRIERSAGKIVEWKQSDRRT